MPKKKQTGSPRASVRPVAAKPAVASALMTTRIDPPHQIAAAEPALPPPEPIPSTIPTSIPAAEPRAASIPPPAAAFTMPLAQSFEQMQNQAAQLTAQLCKQQATLDHREAEVNARAAAVENQVRTARLWLVEKLDELAERKAELNSAASADASSSVRPSRFAEPASPAHQTADAGTRADREPDAEPAALDWHEEFERWRSSLAGAPDESAGVTSAAGDGEPRLRAAERQLAARAAELEARRRDLEIERNTLESEREAFVAERQAERHRLADQRRVMSEKLMRQRTRLRRRRDDFDAREMALRALRADLLREQSQVLEMRLGAEEQWARLRGKADARRDGAA